MSKIDYLRGNEAAAMGAKLARIGFMGAYPMVPSSEVMETIRTYIEKGELKAGYVEADGEKASHLATFGAAATGIRAFNATSSQGLAFMHEGLHMHAGSRMPTVIAIANRSLFVPQGIHCDHTDTISQRDTGWLQIHCETIQEVLDTLIQAYKISEHKEVRTPVFVCYDGYFISHSLERVAVPAQEEVDRFLPPYDPEEWNKTVPDGLPVFTSFGFLDNWFMEFKYIQWRGVEAAKQVIAEVDEEFGKRFGRRYGGLLDPYLTRDAEVILVTTGSHTSTARFAVNVMRKTGRRVGVIKIRSFRPYPREALCEAVGASQAKAVIVLDRIFNGAYTDEVKSALYPLKDRPMVKGFICGLNGRDVATYNMIDMAMQGFEMVKKGSLDQEVEYYFLRRREDQGNA